MATTKFSTRKEALIYFKDKFEKLLTEFKNGKTPIEKNINNLTQLLNELEQANHLDDVKGLIFPLVFKTAEVIANISNPSELLSKLEFFKNTLATLIRVEESMGK